MANRQIYLLSPKELSPETIAVTFAKTSRSPESFREIAAGLNEESSARFHERWVIGYGHESVAEHAVLHIAIENVSRLAVECIESNRLASYTEKSTRYQKWNADSFFIPPELDGHLLRDTYIQACRILFEAYEQSLIPVRAMVADQNPRQEKESEEGYDRRIRSKYVDSCRFLLPAASLANLGMTANARLLEHAISKMLSHPLAEVREIGEGVKRVAIGETPTLVKYAEAASYLTRTAETLAIPQMIVSPDVSSQDWCQLIDYEPDGEIKVLAAAIYRYGGMSYPNAMEVVRSASQSNRAKLAESLLGGLGEHDIPLRELEHTAYTFDLILDQGAYAEFKRHRMMTQTPQMLTTRLGYALPRQIVIARIEKEYRSAMEAAAEAFERLAEWNPHVASYVVPNGFNRRVLFSMNLREAFAFCQLRSTGNAHFSMRRVAHRIAEEIQLVHPLLAKYLHLPNETWQEIEAQNFT